MIQPIAIEYEILADVERVTGLRFQFVDSIPTRNRTVADSVLPILVSWVPKVEDRVQRHTLYRRFHTPHAYRYFDELLSWFRSERDDELRGTVASVLALVVKSRDVERLWTMLRSQTQTDYLLLSKMANLRSPVQNAIRERVVADLFAARLRRGDLQYVAKIDDPQIAAWFVDQANSPDQLTRNLAKRLAQRAIKPPAGLLSLAGSPARKMELRSAEVELDAVPTVLRQWTEEIGLELSAPFETQYLSALEPDLWAVVSGVTVNGSPANLWFRMEDVDTVEVVLTSDSTTQIQ